MTDNNERPSQADEGDIPSGPNEPSGRRQSETYLKPFV
jgi:hypothetical protein